MTKSTVLQVVALILLVLAGYLLYAYFTSESGQVSVLMGVGPLIAGIAMLIISRSDAITKE
jgi:hypothetical protein